MYSDVWGDIAISFSTEIKEAACRVFQSGHAYQCKYFPLPIDEGIEVVNLIASGKREEAVNKAMLYNEKRIFETRPLSNRVTELIDNSGDCLKYKVDSIFRNVIAYGFLAGLHLRDVPVETFITVFRSLDDATLLKIRNIGVSKLKTIHKIQEVLMTTDMEYLCKGCKDVC